MSRIGKLPVAVPAGVTVTIAKGEVRVKGPKGEVVRPFNPALVEFSQEAGVLTVKALREDANAYHGTMRKMLANMVKGVQSGFEKKLEINGVGYKAQAQGQKLVLTVGFSHSVEVPLPAGLTVKIDDNTKLTLQSCDNLQLGDFAAALRNIRPPEPYLGKGIKYAEEVIKRKVGKTGA
jgi:large subunit ribosomal protein L6